MGLQLEIVFFGDSITEDMDQYGTVEKIYQPEYNTGAFGIGGAFERNVGGREKSSFFCRYTRIAVHRAAN